MALFAFAYLPWLKANQKGIDAARLPDPETTVLFVGHQSVGTKGRVIQEAKETGKKVYITAYLAEKATADLTLPPPPPVRFSTITGWPIAS